MKQITQKELLDLIKEKQENARNSFRRATEKSDRDSLLTNKAYIEAYQDLICYINSVEIVPERIEANKGQFVGGSYPEEEIVTTIPKAKQEESGLTQEYIKKMIENTGKPQETPINDRFRDFGNIFIDAKSVDYITIYTDKNVVKRIAYKIGQEKLELISCLCTNEDEEEMFYETFMKEIEWWKYWKQN